MASVLPYFNFVDQSSAAIAFYTSIFGGETDAQMQGQQVVHFEFKSGDLQFMGADLGKDQPGQRSSVVLNCESEEELRDFYAALVAGGEEVFAPMDSGWGAIIAHCIDPFGLTWMLNYDTPST